MPTTSYAPCRIVILGGGYAGLTVAQRLSAQRGIASLTLIDAKPNFQERIRLHQVTAGQVIPSFSYRDFLAPRGVAFLQAQVQALDPDAATVTIRGQDGVDTIVGYDYLIYALGSVVDVDAVPGAREHAHAFHSGAAAERLHGILTQPGTSRVLVVGGGLTGIETAVELAESQRHLRVTLAIEKPWAAESIPGGFCSQAVTYLNQAFDRHNVALRTGAKVVRLSSNIAVTGDGDEIPFDACIWTSGFVPSFLAQKSGIETNRRGQIVTDAFLRSTSHPNIIAVGDAASVCTEEGSNYRMGCATGLAMATAGARTMTALLKGEMPTPFRFIYLFRNASLGRRDGLIQFVDRHDVPRSIAWTGAKAAVWKEYICRSTLSTIGLYAPEKPPALPPIRMIPQLLYGMRQYA